jgi:short-subunit dehydrogenase
VSTALITGATEGIGLEFARVFAADGWDIAIVARDRQRLDTTAAELRATGRTVSTFALDLSLDGAARSLFDAVQAAGLRIDARVNNAGIATHGRFVDVAAADELGMLHLNVVALTELTKLFLPLMVERGAGNVLMLASTSAFQPGPYMAAYYATKSYVLSLAEALEVELAGTGVRITALCPGATHTGFTRRAKMTGETRLFRYNAMDAHRVALAGYRGMRAGRLIVIPGVINNVLAFVVRISPRRIVSRVVGWFNKVPG